MIAAEGAVSIARFMAEILSADADGYYRDRDPLGAGGDFVTAPEISQMFGELLGLWAVDTWQQMGRPAPFRLIELGPGRGTLMADALRAARLSPDFLHAAELHLVEINQALRASQRERLGEFDPAWHDELGTVPAGPLVLIANEFLDALPVHQMVRTAAGWRERAVGLDQVADRLAWTDATPSPALAPLAEAIHTAAVGDIYEIGPARTEIVTAVAQRCRRHGGAALFIDYGHDGDMAAGDTLQAVRRHAYHDPLDAPGTADLSSHVAFGTLRRAASEAGARPWGPIAQGLFLLRLGLQVRADRLKSTATTADQAAAVDAALHRLIHAGEMGTLFKVLAVTGANASAPAGFEEVL